MSDVPFYVETALRSRWGHTNAHGAPPVERWEVLRGYSCAGRPRRLTLISVPPHVSNGGTRLVG